MNPNLSDLHMKVQNALLEHPRTREYGIDVLEQNGVITLKGNVPSREVSQTAEDIAAGVFGVRGVINELEISEVNETRNR
ncbi:MAG: BON domain-containing protein [Chloroflexota bacterium]